ncbi:N-acetyltransferase [Microbacterium sorbitolivorans]|uniref:GNAT family N-acetyltransferase n=1 Tax=Microbacterium sorbitolivorans TaxID=1867410 RepID=A0A367XXV0_9MICO|nr:GNAT family N-acetyltransferase [Microbacterium sorbitolivorans]RCK58433.1 GNAT family N-acetyltransferase [Microbacterium sorbitolivorans]GGF36469.1 N-acetyltransferase [Microbacterium sorbitolivorans]
MTAEIAIRTVTSDDKEAWGRLFRGYRDFYGMEPDERVIETVWGWLTDPAHELVGHIAIHDGRPAAIAHWRRFARPSRGATATFLDDLFTDPELRGEGIGSALIANLQRVASEEGLSEVRWITSEANTDAQRLYNRVADRVPLYTYIAAPKP